MANIANAFAEKLTVRAWNVEPQLTGTVEAAYTIPASNVNFYDGQAMGRDTAGGIVNIDDTAKAEFVGVQKFAVVENVLSTDSPMLKYGFIDRPYAFVALIAAAAKGDEQRRVYWLYNNQVAYSGVNNWNYAGSVLAVVDATHVLVLSPWLSRSLGDGNATSLQAVGTGTVTLNKFSVNNDFTASDTVTINLPVSTTVSSGDMMTFIKTGSGAYTITMKPGGTDSINGVTTPFNSTTVQFSITRVETDGAGNWWVKQY